MARSDLLINLVRASASGDQRTMRRTVEALVAEERAKQHNVLADRLERAADAAGTNGQIKVLRPPNDAAGRAAQDFVAEVHPRHRLGDLVLPDAALVATEQMLEEQQRASLLRSHGIEPRHRVLLVGPPGNGKTTLAEAIAEALAVPFFIVRYEALMGSFLGETAGRLRRVFDYARTRPCVLFFDEFDAVGKERGDTHETGEIKRVVTSLLMQMDDLPSYVVVVAATNHAELLDRAVWRRFQLRLDLPAPTARQLVSFLDRASGALDVRFGMPVDQVAKALGRVSYSEAQDFLLDVARRRVLAMGGQPIVEIVREQLRLRGRRIGGSATESLDHAGPTASEVTPG